MLRLKFGAPARAAGGGKHVAARRAPTRGGPGGRARPSALASAARERASDPARVCGGAPGVRPAAPRASQRALASISCVHGACNR